MGEVTLEELAARNPRIHLDVLRIFFDALELYRQASANIEKNGAVTGHPKTGAPITNPWLPIRDLAGKTISRFHAEHPRFDEWQKRELILTDSKLRR